MKINIEIDDNLINEAMKLSHAKSKKEIVNLALKEFVATRKRKELLLLRGKVKWFR